MRLAPRVVATGLAVALVATWAVAMACDDHKTTKTSTAGASKAKATKITFFTAENSAQKGAACTAEQMAACKAKGASAAHLSACAGHSKTTATAVTASASGCGDHSAKATTASSGSCAGKKATTTGKKGTTAKTTFFTAGFDGSNDKVKAVATGGSHCGTGSGKVQSSTAHADCEACSDMFACGEELNAASARVQVVRLKNGVMFVYTAESPGKINAVQSAMARRNSHMAAYAASGDKAKLCGECRTMRNAMAGGKLHREVINIEGGALTLMTSSDPSIVAKIHAMVDDKSTKIAKI